MRWCILGCILQCAGIMQEIHPSMVYGLDQNHCTLDMYIGAPIPLQHIHQHPATDSACPVLADICYHRQHQIDKGTYQLQNIADKENLLYESKRKQAQERSVMDVIQQAFPCESIDPGQNHSGFICSH